MPHLNFFRWLSAQKEFDIKKEDGKCTTASAAFLSQYAHAHKEKEIITLTSWPSCAGIPLMTNLSNRVRACLAENQRDPLRALFVVRCCPVLCSMRKHPAPANSSGGVCSVTPRPGSGSWASSTPSPRRLDWPCMPKKRYAHSCGLAYKCAVAAARTSSAVV